MGFRKCASDVATSGTKSKARRNQGDWVASMSWSRIKQTFWEISRLRPLFFSASVFMYIPHKSYLPNTRARRNLINKGLDTCTAPSTRRGRRLGRFRKRLHLAPGRVERVIGSEDECLPVTKCIRPHEADGDRMDARLCQGCDSCSQPAQRIVSLEFRPWPPTPNGQRGEKIMSPC